jgi:hypothetical protein
VTEIRLLREPSKYERALFQKFTESDFAGRDVVKRQLDACQVATILDDGTLQIYTPVTEKALVRFRIPVEAYGKDTKDGLPIQVLLHVVDGIVDELEILKMGSDSMPNMPAVEDLELIVYPIKG